MQLILQNFKTHKVKNYCKKEDSIKKILTKKIKRMYDKDNWVYYIFDNSNDVFYTYTPYGDLLSKEYSGIISLGGCDCKEIIPYDYYTNNSIKNGDIVYCSFDNSYYIMIAEENKPDIGNKLKFLGINEYAEEYTTWGISQYFLSIVSEENIKLLNLQYLYDMKKLYDNDQYAEKVKGV